MSVAVTPQLREETRRRRERRSAMMRARWQDPEYRAQQKAVRSTNAKAMWSDPKAAANRRAKLVTRNRSKEQRETCRAALTKLNTDAAFKAKRQATMKEFHNRPEIKAAFVEMVRARNKTRAAKQRANRQAIPHGKKNLYRKLRDAGFDRTEALRQCWIAADG